MFKYVVTVCSEAEAEGCPIFPGVTTRLHWPFPDPARFEGTFVEKLQRTREVRDMIKAEIDRFCQERCGVESQSQPKPG
jgi:arsenate reductase